MPNNQKTKQTATKKNRNVAQILETINGDAVVEFSGKNFVLSNFDEGDKEGPLVQRTIC